MAEYQNMSVGELRKELRKQHPQCKGAFAANVTKALALDILEGRITPEAGVAQWHKADGATPTEGVGGENPPADGKSHLKQDANVTEQLGEIITACKTLGKPDAAAEIERLLENEKARSQLPTAASIKATDGKVTINGVEIPVIMDAPDDTASDEVKTTWAYVPPVDQYYSFDAWSGETKCGAVKFKQEVSDFLTLLMLDKRVSLVGPPSAGKTSLPMQIAALAHWPVTRFNGNRDITVQDFVGNYEAHDGSTVWVDGPLVRAMKDGHLLLIDEYDHMPAECSSILHSVLEPKGKLVITGNGGEVVSPHDNFRIVGTSNTGGFGDESGLHRNAQVQDAALLSRWDAVIRVGWMKPEHEEAILCNISGIDAAEAKLIVKVATDSRRATENTTIMYPITLRQTIGWAAMAVFLDTATGFALSVLNKVPKQDAPAIAEIAQRHFGNKFGGKLA